jgi:hypothetical protein
VIDRQPVCTTHLLRRQKREPAIQPHRMPQVVSPSFEPPLRVTMIAWTGTDGNAKLVRLDRPSQIAQPDR